MTASVRFEEVGAELLAGVGCVVVQIVAIVFAIVQIVAFFAALVGDVGPAKNHRVRVAFASLLVVAGLVIIKVSVAFAVPAPTVIGLTVIESVAICVTLTVEAGPSVIEIVAIVVMLTVEVGSAVTCGHGYTVLD